MNIKILEQHLEEITITGVKLIIRSEHIKDSSDEYWVSRIYKIENQNTIPLLLGYGFCKEESIKMCLEALLQWCQKDD